MILNNKKAFGVKEVVLSLIIIGLMIAIFGKYIGNADDSLDASIRCENNPAGIEGICADSPPDGYNPDPWGEGAGCSDGENCYRKFG